VDSNPPEASDRVAVAPPRPIPLHRHPSAGCQMEVMFQPYSPGTNPFLLSASSLKDASASSGGGVDTLAATAAAVAAAAASGAGSAVDAAGALRHLVSVVPQALTVMQAATQLASDQHLVIQKLDRTVQLLYAKLEKVSNKRGMCVWGVCGMCGMCVCGMCVWDVWDVCVWDVCVGCVCV
jgi:hypothetical protein